MIQTASNNSNCV